MPLMKSRCRILAIGLVLVGLTPSVPAQTSDGYGDDPFQQPLESLTEPEITVSRQLRFRLLGEIALPGPLPGQGPRMNGSMIEVPVAGGIAVTPVEVGAIAEIERRDAGPEFDPRPWALSENERRRYRALPDGRVTSEKRCDRCESGWKKRWRLRVPGNTMAPPLLHRKLLFFGALDNLIYCIKARNGHQIWTADVAGRTSRQLVYWTDALGDEPEQQFSLASVAVLVVPDSGSELLALDPETGQRVARINLERGQGKLIGVPVVTPDGKIVVAHQKYDETEAALRVYRLDLPGMLPLTEPTPVEPEAEIATGGG
jgi:hypothetical protein